MQSSNKGKPPLGIIFDCAFGHRADDPLALALLFNLDGKNEALILALSLSTADLKAAASLTAISRFYRMTERDPFPIGLFRAAKLQDETPMTAALMAKLDGEGKPQYRHGIRTWQDTADPLPLMRNALASQPDQSIAFIITGPATNAARLLSHPGAKTLIEQKVKMLVIATGAYAAGQEGQADFALRSDIAAARKLFAEWPTPIVAAGAEVGAQILFPDASIKKDFAWTPAHPVADAYRAYRMMPYDAPTAALAAVLHAAKPEEHFFTLSEPGKIQVDDDGRTTFIPAANARHCYLIVDQANKEQVLSTYIQMASAQPVPLPGRQRPTTVQQQQL